MPTQIHKWRTAMVDWYDVPGSEEFDDYFCLGEDDPDPEDQLPFYPMSREVSCAFIYAAKVASGIKIGVAGTGTSTDSVHQLKSRLSTYGSISPVELLGICSCSKGDALRKEASFHKKLEAYRVEGVGRELFSDTPEVRQYLLGEMFDTWHQPVRNLPSASPVFRQMLDHTHYFCFNTLDPDEDDIAKSEYRGVYVTDFHAEKEGWYAPFCDWKDYLRLVPEINLYNHYAFDCIGDCESMWLEHARELGIVDADYDESQAEQGLIVHLLNHFLPLEECRNRSLRARFNDWADGFTDHGFPDRYKEMNSGQS